MCYSTRKKQNYAFRHTGNAENTVVYFVMSGNCTVDAADGNKLKLEA
jgi:hypothetical protein